MNKMMIWCHSKTLSL